VGFKGLAAPLLDSALSAACAAGALARRPLLQAPCGRAAVARRVRLVQARGRSASLPDCAGVLQPRTGPAQHRHLCAPILGVLLERQNAVHAQSAPHGMGWCASLDAGLHEVVRCREQRRARTVDRDRLTPQAGEAGVEPGGVGPANACAVSHGSGAAPWPAPGAHPRPALAAWRHSTVALDSHSIREKFEQRTVEVSSAGCCCLSSRMLPQTPGSC